MKSNRMLFGFITLLVIVSLACGGSAAEPATNPTLPPVPTNPPAQQEQPQNQGSSNEIVTFTDENGLLAFDLPGDWTYEQTSDTNFYVDSFSSPDGSALIESLVYNDGTAFVKSQKGKFALDLINTFYSATGQVGDIRVTSDQIMDDGSERLEWSSKSGGFSGVSFLETRGDNTTFLLFTAKWLDTVDQATFDAVNNAIASYRIP
jgi:hypothetical protein